MLSEFDNCVPIDHKIGIPHCSRHEVPSVGGGQEGGGVRQEGSVPPLPSWKENEYIRKCLDDF